MITLAILSLVITMAVPRIKKTNTNIKTIVRELGVLSREVRNTAQLKNGTYRIAFLLNGQQDSYWVEASNRPILVMSEDKKKKIQSLSEKDRPPEDFQKVDRPLKEERKMPPGLFIKSVETKGLSAPIEKGNAYIHFSPEGLVQQSIVQLTDGKKLIWSLVFNPLTGHTDIVEHAISLKELESDK